MRSRMRGADGNPLHALQTFHPLGLLLAGRLKELVADLSLDNQILKEVAEENF